MMEVKALKLSDVLKASGVREINYSNEGLEIHFDDTDKVVAIPILKYQHDTIRQLDSSFENGLISMEQYTQIDYFLTRQLPKVWDEIHARRDIRSGDKARKEIPIKKYSANGTIPLLESIVIDGDSKFVYLENGKVQLVDSIPRNNDILVPSDTIDTRNPIPFIFKDKQELEQYIERAKIETLDSLFLKVETINKKYVDVETHYHTLFTADMIWSWLQDRFGTTHYNIITGDNGSGKNSQLLVYKFLGYRAFYVVSASAPNYYTKMGNVEEGQITIAEDEAEDIAKDRDKRNVFKSGYASGGNVPKVELEGGRKSEDWLVYCHKLVAMEELPNYKDMKGILDRSFVFRFVIGEPQYNIKDIINTAGAPEFKPLYDELIDTRKLLFCWRLVNYYEPIQDVKLNIKNRISELTKPLIRLFQNAPIALEKILNSLSQFMAERSEVKQDSFESKLHQTIEYLVKERNKILESDKPLEDCKTLGKTTFTNESIRNILREVTEGEEIEDKKDCFYSSLEGIGLVSQTRITKILKSKFKVKTPSIRLSDKTYRCVQFEEKYLDRIKSNYNTPSKIEIIKDQSCYTVTDVTLSGKVLASYTDIINTKIQGNQAQLPELEPLLYNQKILDNSQINCNKRNSVTDIPKILDTPYETVRSVTVNKEDSTDLGQVQ